MFSSDTCRKHLAAARLVLRICVPCVMVINVLQCFLKDNLDVERERRSLAILCNMLARRFPWCTKPVKVTLFKVICQSFYMCSLWMKDGCC